MSRRPAPWEVLEFLRAGAQQAADGAWLIGGDIVPRHSAFGVAELCMILDQPLSLVLTTDLFLAMARRLAALEDALERVGR